MKRREFIGLAAAGVAASAAADCRAQKEKGRMLFGVCCGPEKVPLLIVLNKVHLASYSCYEFLYQMISGNPNSKIALLCTINEVYVVPDYVKSIKNDIIFIHFLLFKIIKI